MKILALESYYGGSHRAFLDGWQQQGGHDWTLLTLPPNKWKWRMRHAAITFAQQVNELVGQGETWDALFCSDMLNLAEFLGLVDESVRKLPKIVYFHENQLTYPVQVESERDYQYCMTNITTAVAADAVWFNSAFHRDEFLDAIGAFFKRMPDYQPMDLVAQIRAKSSIHPPGIEPIEPPNERADGPVRILWAARWEHDKNPDDFFAAVKILKDRGVAFRLNVIGEQFRGRPAVFDWARDYFADQIDRWGYQSSRSAYEQALAESDIVVSTANHEFFGIGVLEAVTAGCFPLLPNRLSYPAILASLVENEHQRQAFLYDGTVNDLAAKLEKMSAIQTHPDPPPFGNVEGLRAMAAKIIQPEPLGRYGWPQRAAAMGRAMATVGS